jgi:hypothetical protein
MATTTAKITITSADLIDSQALSLSAETTLTQEGTATGIVNTTGLARKVFTSTSDFILFDGDAYTDGSHKIYIRNLETDVTKYFDIKINAELIGRIYGGDWIFIPWRAAADTSDVKVAAGDTNAQSLEYMLFYE